MPRLLKCGLSPLFNRIADDLWRVLGDAPFLVMFVDDFYEPGQCAPKPFCRDITSMLFCVLVPFLNNWRALIGSPPLTVPLTVLPLFRYRTRAVRLLRRVRTGRA